MEWKPHENENYMQFPPPPPKNQRGQRWNIVKSTLGVYLYTPLCASNIYIYIYMRWVQVIPGVTLKSCTFSKPLDLSKSNGKKRY